MANVKRGFSEQKWADSKSWTGEKLARTNNRKYRPGEKQKPDLMVAKARKRVAAHFYRLKTGRFLTGQYLAWTTRRLDATCWCQYRTQSRDRLFTLPSGRTSRRCYGTPPSRKLPGRTRQRHKTSIVELPADQRCSQAVLDFLETTNVGGTPGRPVAEEAYEEASEASEWEERVWEERV